MWPNYWSFSFSISPSNEYSELISFRIDWFDLLVVQGILKSLLQHHGLKGSVLRCSAFFMVQLSHLYMTSGKTIALTIQAFVDKVMSLLFNTLSRFVIAFLPSSKHVLILWLQSMSTVVLEPKKIKSVTASTFPPYIYHEVMGLDAMIFSSVQFSSVIESCLTLCEHAKLPCPSPAPGPCSNSCPLSQWCHPTSSSSDIPFSCCLQSFPISGSFPMSQFFTSGSQSIGPSASASILPMNIQDWFPLGWTGWISLWSKGLSSVFSSTTVWKHQFFGAQPSLWPSSHICTWLLEKA